jgi:sugar/nucleoside kinase (ribokinase family)
MDVVCLGILVADVIARPVDDPPRPGSLSLVEGIEVHAGGCALNSASALTALGLEASVVGKVGRDLFGDFLLRVLQERGLATEGVLRDASVGTSATVVLVDSSGERTFLHVPGANAALTAGELDPDRLYAGRVLHLAGALVLERLDGKPLAELATEAERRGILTSLDTVWDPTGRWSRLEPCLPHLDFLLPSLVEGRELSGETDPSLVAARLRERGVRNVLLTMGADGCYVSGEGCEGVVDAPAVEAVDGTGAGDAFAAGVLYGALAGWPLERCARFGCAAGAIASMSVGATMGGKDLTDVLALAGLT